MAKERYIDTKFWDDNYIVKLDPVEKLLFIYFLTNPLTNICGIYEISLRRIAFDTGIEEETISTLLKRFEEAKKIKYERGYIIIKNFIKYQKDNPKINKGIISLLEHIPKELSDWIAINHNRLCIDYDSLSHLNTNTNRDTNIDINITPYEEIISYLNEKAETNYKDTTKKTRDLIKVKMNDGFGLEDFKTVIDKKVKSWNGTEWQKYLRPETLFGNKFEGYLNEKDTKSKPDWRTTT